VLGVYMRRFNAKFGDRQMKKDKNGRGNHI
jgi:hypothetical protein